MSRLGRPLHIGSGALVGACGLLIAAGAAQAGGTVSVDMAALKGRDALSVAVAGIAPGGPLPSNYAMDGRNLSPPVSWSGGPAATRSYAVVMQDPDAPGASPHVHWIVYDVPATVNGLPRGMRNVDQPAHPLGALQGRNDHGSVGYSGPHPPPADPPHHYHLQVFALDQVPRLRPGADLATLERAMAGHVLASGDLTAVYPGPTASSKTPAPGAPALGPGG